MTVSHTQHGKKPGRRINQWLRLQPWSLTLGSARANLHLSGYAAIRRQLSDFLVQPTLARQSRVLPSSIGGPDWSGGQSLVCGRSKPQM